MDTIDHSSLTSEIAALCDWWLQAGVDQAFEDAPRVLAPAQGSGAGPRQVPARASRPAAAASSPRPISDPASEPALAQSGAAADPGPMPSTLEEFHQWWCRPDHPWLARHLPAAAVRIAARGPAGAPLLMLAPMPEAEDRDSLLEGPQGLLLDNISRALGLDPALCYRASALPAHVALPDWGHLADGGLAAILRRHLALARPERIVIFARSLERMLAMHCGLDRGMIKLDGRQVPVFTTVEPALLLARPGRLARLWPDLLEWISIERSPRP